MSGRGTPATALLAREGVPHVVHSYVVAPDAPSYGEGAAAALGVEPERMLKTLLAVVDGARLGCAVVPVAGELDLKSFASALGGKKAVMADPAAAERSSGYVVGGISPLAQRTRLPTAVDETVELFDTVLVSAGRRGLSVELAPADLLRLTGAVVADLAR
ncbi:MAG TPA: Cys-tRNA(Pro) deacylase [Mycobacteriales bacterium]|nr:Cys-tRNA(Pro) deacylase [Mycobacteriales bacterium]